MVSFLLKMTKLTLSDIKNLYFTYFGTKSIIKTNDSSHSHMKRVWGREESFSNWNTLGMDRATKIIQTVVIFAATYKSLIEPEKDFSTTTGLAKNCNYLIYQKLTWKRRFLFSIIFVNWCWILILTPLWKQRKWRIGYILTKI